MSKYLVEWIGTFFLVTTIGMTAGAGDLAPVAIACGLIAMIYAGGPVSGAHYNPAVTLAVCMRGKCSPRDVPGYLVAQVTGALAAAFTVSFLNGSPPVTAKDINVTQAMVAEFLFTFVLAYVILSVATAKATSGNSYYGLAIGFAVLAGAYAVGGVSGGAFNPAVAIGATAMGLFKVAHIWVYLVGNFGGAALAAVVFKMTHPDDN